MSLLACDSAHFVFIGCTDVHLASACDDEPTREEAQAIRLNLYAQVCIDKPGRNKASYDYANDPQRKLSNILFLISKSDFT